MNKSHFISIWDVTPETAHPRAKQLIGESILWNYGDEDSPLGNDAGADAFAAYLAFHNDPGSASISDLVQRQLKTHGLTESDWDAIDEARLRELLAGKSGPLFLQCDDYIIGLAFAQLLLEGYLAPTVQRRAIAALRRQGTDVVLRFRGGGGEAARKGQLAEFRRILERV